MRSPPSQKKNYFVRGMRKRGYEFFAGRSKPHISHSESAPLLRKVHRRHSHSEGPWAARGVPAPLDLPDADGTVSGLRATLVLETFELVGGGFHAAAAAP